MADAGGFGGWHTASQYSRAAGGLAEQAFFAPLPALRCPTRLPLESPQGFRSPMQAVIWRSESPDLFAGRNAVGSWGGQAVCIGLTAVGDRQVDWARG